MKSKEWDNVTTSVRSKIETEKELLTEKQWMIRKRVPVDKEAGKLIKDVL